MENKKIGNASDNQNKEEKLEKVGSMITYRPDIKVVDCTLRDGGLVNNFGFEDNLVQSIYKSLIASGIDYMELGYKASKKIFAVSEFGRWKFCDEDVIRKIAGENDSDLKLSVMADAERTDYKEDILPKGQSIIDLIRIATYIHQIPSALDMIKDAHDKGYETSINLMAVSTVNENELEEALALLSESEVDIIYIVDSFGSFYPENIRHLAQKFLHYAKAADKMTGIHSHNNQQLAFANTIEALTLGVSYLDSTIQGFGRGAGNCNTELLLGFLKNPKYNIRPILKCIAEDFLSLKQSCSWGFEIPYMLTGQLNRHPRAAIKYLGEKDNTNYTSFYDSLIDED